MTNVQAGQAVDQAIVSIHEDTANPMHASDVNGNGPQSAMPEFTSVPEPSTYASIAVGALVLVGLGRRRRKLA